MRARALRLQVHTIHIRDGAALALRMLHEGLQALRANEPALPMA